MLRRFAFRLQAGVGTMFPPLQREQLGYNTVGIHTSPRIAVTLIDAIAVQVAFNSWVWPASNDPATMMPRAPGVALGPMAGLRLEPEIVRNVRVFLDADFGGVFTGPLTRFAYQLGAGAEFRAHPWVGISPVFVFGHVVQRKTGYYDQDALYWCLGLQLTIRAFRPTPLEEEHAATRAARRNPAEGNEPGGNNSGNGDFDDDGVLDTLDQCPTVPMGAHRDPHRLGCPIPDSDRDGVLDNADQCPAVPAGPYPDPFRPGCPDRDQDGDGVGDHQDRCPTEPQGLTFNRSQEGCPLPDQDHDWVPDGQDACPRQSGMANTDAARNGCPSLLQLNLRDARPRFEPTQPFRFVNDSNVVDRRSEPVLQALLNALEASPTLAVLAVRVPERLAGERTSDATLAGDRARALVQWFRDHGLPEGRVIVSEETEPLPTGNVRFEVMRIRIVAPQR